MPSNSLQRTQTRQGRYRLNLLFSTLSFQADRAWKLLAFLYRSCINGRIGDAHDQIIKGDVLIRAKQQVYVLRAVAGGNSVTTFLSPIMSFSVAASRSASSFWFTRGVEPPFILMTGSWSSGMPLGTRDPVANGFDASDHLLAHLRAVAAQVRPPL